MFDLDNASHTVIEQSNAATNPYFVNTSYASFLTSQSPHATIACLMLAYSFSPKVRKYLLGSPIFPTGTKVSRGVPDFNVISYSELYVKNNILTLYARSSIII